MGLTGIEGMIFKTSMAAQEYDPAVGYGNGEETPKPKKKRKTRTHKPSRHSRAQAKPRACAVARR